MIINHDLPDQKNSTPYNRKSNHSASRTIRFCNQKRTLSSHFSGIKFNPLYQVNSTRRPKKDGAHATEHNSSPNDVMHKVTETSFQLMKTQLLSVPLRHF